MTSEGGATTSKTKTNRKLIPREDEALVYALQELCTLGHWKTDNGFRPGYLVQLEKMINEKLPTSGIQAKPHIDSRYKHLKKQTNAITEMLENGSGFAWDHDDNMIVCEPHIFEGWVKSHPDAVGLRLKPFPHYHALSEIFGKDRATGTCAESAFDAAVDIERNGPTPFQNVDSMDASEDNDGISEFASQIPSTYVENDLFGGPPSMTQASGSRTQGNTRRVDASEDSGPSPQGTRRKRRARESSIDDMLTSTLKDMMETNKELVETNKEFNKATTEALKTMANAMSKEASQKEAVVGEMIRLGFPELQYLLNAANWVMSNNNKLYIFFSLPDQERRVYLHSFFMNGCPPSE